MRFWPTRQKKVENELVADLDLIVKRTVNFKLHGKVHKIEPFTTEQFLVFANRLAELQALQRKEVVKSEEIIEQCYRLVHAAAPSIEKKDIEAMTPYQMGATLEMLLKLVTGNPDLGEKKKP